MELMLLKGYNLNFSRERCLIFVDLCRQIKDQCQRTHSEHILKRAIAPIVNLILQVGEYYLLRFRKKRYERI